MNQLWSQLESRASMESIMAHAGQVGTGFMSRYAAAARYGELRQMAAPATLDIGALDLGVEDHATAAPLTVRRTDEALDALESILLTELLIARDMTVLTGRSIEHGAGVAAALASIDAACAAVGPVSLRADVHAALQPLLTTTILDAADSA
jgi:histidine ammonia-lyase